MNGLRCDRILAGTALALILAAPFDVFAQEKGKLAAVPTGAPPAGQASTETSAAPTAPGEPQAATPVTPTEQSPAPDPLAALDPADRVVAEKIRDLLAATPDRIFASKNER